MSVLIKGIDLPEAYTSAWLTVFECVGEHTFMKTYKVSPEQIQAIPPHGRLIDADAFIREINNRIDAAIKWGTNAIADRENETRLRAEQAVATFCEASLTARKMPTIIEAEEGEGYEQN